MKKFNKDKYLKKLKLKRFWQSNSRYFYIGVPCILCGILCIYFAYSKFFVIQEKSVVQTKVGNFVYGDVVINNYVNGEYAVDAPAQGTGYKVDKIVCDNGATGTWDGKDWGPTISNVTRRSKCNIYFVDAEMVSIGNSAVPLDYYGLCPTLNADGTATVTDAESQYGYLCSMKDAYGTSYYYRGNVTNNYVLFAGFYWRIVRINGDGTIRVIYDGTSAHSNGESSTDRQIGTSAFNSYWKKDNVQESTRSHIYYDNAGVGYMYGNRDGIIEPSTQYSTSSYTNTNTYYIAKEYTYNASTDRFTLKDPIAVLGSAMTSDYVGYYAFHTHSPGSFQYVIKITSVTAGSSEATVGYKHVIYGTTSKEKAQTNTNDSTIRTYLDNWYKTNIVGTSNEQYLADNIFCNDRSISTGIQSGYSNLGYGTEKTAYRWYYFAGDVNNNKMMLICPQKNDAFTVSDTTNGNGALTYPVGLLSTDEIVLAGGWDDSNSGYYLYSGQEWWASSPGELTGEYATVHTVYSDGDAEFRGIVNFDYGVRPVFNLKAEVLAQGSGTASDPYHPAS